MKERFKNQLNVTKLYIRSLKPETTPEILKEAFSQFGEVEYFSIREHKRDEKILKFGFIQFKTKEQADQAIQEAPSNEKILGISLVSPAYVKLAQAKHVRKKYLKI